jgi:hypothetical protein
MSGRALRRLPVLALARFIGLGMSTLPLQSDEPDSANGGAPNVEGWLTGMETVIQEQGDGLQRVQ